MDWISFPLKAIDNSHRNKYYSQVYYPRHGKTFGKNKNCITMGEAVKKVR